MLFVKKFWKNGKESSQKTLLDLIWASPPTQRPPAFTTEPTLNHIGEGNKHIRMNVAGETLCHHSAFSWPQLLPARRRNLPMGLGALHLAGCLWMTPTYSGEKEKTGAQSKVWTRPHSKSTGNDRPGHDTQIHVTLANDQTQQSKHVEIQRMEKQTLKAHKTHTQHRLRHSHIGTQASL